MPAWRGAATGEVLPPGSRTPCTTLQVTAIQCCTDDKHSSKSSSVMPSPLFNRYPELGAAASSGSLLLPAGGNSAASQKSRGGIHAHPAKRLAASASEPYIQTSAHTNTNASGSVVQVILICSHPARLLSRIPTIDTCMVASTSLARAACAATDAR